MALKLAVIGFRHGHILDLYQKATAMGDIDIVATCEEDAETRRQITTEQGITITHENIDDLLETVDCDAVAIGDTYGRRGSVTIRALSRGKHVLSDKPICTSLDELNEIEQLSYKHGCKVGCMLDMRDTPQFIGVRNLIQSGTIGEVHAIAFGGQHPLLLGARPSWYFEPGQHGGTINDIAIHAIDALPWITGGQLKQVVAARCWNAFARAYPHFKDAGQLLLAMDNGCGVMGDVSYFMPDSTGYSSPFYWRTTFWGRNGVLETSVAVDQITVSLNGEQGIRYESTPDGTPGGYLRSFMRDIEGTLHEDELSTQNVLRAARSALIVQQAADQGLYDISL